MQFLKDDFISKYPEFPEHMTNVGQFVYYRTYSRFLPELGRRETWKETARRAVDYNIRLAYKHIKKIGHKPNVKALCTEAEDLFDSMFNLKQFLSGRTLWIASGEGGVADKYPLANFNCSFLTIQRWDDLGDLTYALMCGTGVGFKSTPEMTAALPPIRTNVEIQHSEYKPVAPAERYEKTVLKDMENGYGKIYFGDSKEGWTEGLKLFLRVLTDPAFEHIHTLKFSYNSIRPKGEKLKTFGGTASGFLPLKELMQGIDDTLKGRIDPFLAPIETDDRGYGRVRPIHILTMGNLCGASIVVGGVRRTAEIWLSSLKKGSEDYESMFAKYAINGLWDEEAFERHEDIRQQLIALEIPVPGFWDQVGRKMYSVTVDKISRFYETKEEAEAAHPGEYIHFPANPGRKLEHRRMSNNSIAFDSKPSRELLHLIFTIMRAEGEPGFVNLEAAARRRLRGLGITNPSRELLEHTMITLGLNPCAEILLDSGTPETNGGGGVCNLTTVNFMMFVYQNIHGQYGLDIGGLMEAQRRSARAGLRMTLATLELPSWDKLQQRDRLLGTSFTGEKDAKSLLGWSEAEWDCLMSELGRVSIEAAELLAREYRVSVPLLVNTVKPEGTLSQVASSLVIKGGSPVSSGLHYAEAPFFIRRVRINAADPLAQAVKDLPGWIVSPEVGTEGATREEQMANARTLVIDFPVASGANRTLDDVSAAEQLDGYFRTNSIYTSHNSSNTIRVRDNEWEQVEEIIFSRWDEFVAVSFLAYSGGSYQLAPYEKISEERYQEMISTMAPFDPSRISLYEQDIETFTAAQAEVDAMNCEGGACAIR